MNSRNKLLLSALLATAISAMPGAGAAQGTDASKKDAKPAATAKPPAQAAVAKAPARAECVIKPVMTDDEIDACRPAGRRPGRS